MLDEEKRFYLLKFKNLIDTYGINLNRNWSIHDDLDEMKAGYARIKLFCILGELFGINFEELKSSPKTILELGNILKSNPEIVSVSTSEIISELRKLNPKYEELKLNHETILEWRNSLQIEEYENPTNVKF